MKQKYTVRYTLSKSAKVTTEGGGRLPSSQWGNSWQSKWEDSVDHVEIICHTSSPSIFKQGSNEAIWGFYWDWVLNEIPKPSLEDFNDIENPNQYWGGELPSKVVEMTWEAEIREDLYSDRSETYEKIRVNGMNQKYCFSYWKWNGYNEPGNCKSSYQLQSMLSWDNYIAIVHKTNNEYPEVYSSYDDGRWIEMLGLKDGDTFGYGGQPRRCDYVIGESVEVEEEEVIEEEEEVSSDFDNGFFSHIKIG